MTSEAKRGGVLIRVDDVMAFVPASVAVKVAPYPQIARLAGAPAELLGIALFEGSLIPVVALSPRGASPPASSAAMVVCAYGGEQIGLVGLEVLGTGTYPADATTADGIVDAGRAVPAFDVARLYARVHGTARWALGQRHA